MATLGWILCKVKGHRRYARAKDRENVLRCPRCGHEKAAPAKKQTA